MTADGSHAGAAHGSSGGSPSVGGFVTERQGRFHDVRAAAAGAPVRVMGPREGRESRMARKLKSDRLLFTTTLLLVAGSIVMVYSASNVLAAEKYGDPNCFLRKQVMFAAIGLAAMFAAMRIDYGRYRDPRIILTTLGLSLLALAAVLLVGPEINGSRRWFAIAGAGIQPSEFAKLALVLFTAAVLERRMERIGDLRYSLGPIGVALAPIVVLIMLQPDFGSTVTLIAIVGVMVFAAGLPWRYLALMAAPILPGLVALAVFWPYRMRRLTAFLDPWSDRLGDGYQIVQSILAVGPGASPGRASATACRSCSTCRTRTATSSSPCSPRNSA